MENMSLFLITIVVYRFIWFMADFRPISWREHAKRVALITLLALPININGNVFTIAGNAVAEKNIISLFSPYQRAGLDAVNVFGLSYQNAGRDALNLFSLSYQNAGRDAATIAGLTVQNAKRSATIISIIAIYQHVGNKTRAFGAFSSLTKE